ncbi:MAG TPA: hypothetical protein VNA17_12530 [Pyrinomonadaceae bacterium]|nr:hypothetical protein [Pyrinomonadaceae bacterium]
MKRMISVKSVCAVLALFVAFGASDAFGQKRKPVLKRKVVAKRVVTPSIPMYSVASGSVIRARMNRTLSSKTAQVGNTFTATVTEPVYSTNGVVVVPVGSIINGRVDSVTRARNEGKPGAIDASFHSIRLPNGRLRAINGSLTDLEGNTSSDNEGTVGGKKMKNRKIIFIGGGGAGGAILGAAVGGGKGALIGGLLGAGAGFLGDRYTKGKEAEVTSGTEFGVYLNQGITLPRFVESTPINQ